MRYIFLATMTLFIASCGREQDAARFENVEDRADIESPALEDPRDERGSTDAGYRQEAPLHVDQNQEVAAPAPEDD